MELKPGYKKTDVGVIPEEWDVSKIEPIINEISMGPFGSDIKVSNFISAGVPVLSGANVASARLKDSFENFVSFAKAKSLKKAVAHRGDIVVTHRGTLGQISYIPDDAEFDGYVISQSQFRVRFIDDIVIPPWVVLFFLSKQGSKSLLEGKGHTGVPAIAQPTTTFRDLSIPLPPLPEQRAIAEALSDVDVLIASLDRLIAKKRDLKQAAIQELLTGKRRLPGFSGEWEVRRLGDVLKVRHGKSQGGVVAVGGNYPILATGGEIGRTNHFLYDKPSVLIGRKGTIDNPQYVEEPFWTIDTLFFTEISDLAVPKFMFYTFSTINWRSYNEASGVPSLNASTIESIEFICPRQDEQVAIATVLSDMDAEIAALEIKQDKTRSLKQGMMQELLTGRIRLV